MELDRFSEDVLDDILEEERWLRAERRHRLTVRRYHIRLEPIVEAEALDLYEALPSELQVDCTEDGLAAVIRGQFLSHVLHLISGDPRVTVNTATGDGRFEVDVACRRRRVWFTFTEVST